MDATQLLEHTCADAWPPVIENTLGQWRLRAADGFTGRANSALAVGAPGVPVPDALAQVRAFAERHGIEPMAQAIHGSAEETDLAASGWQPYTDYPNGHEVTVLVGPTTSGNPGSARMLDAPTPGWWELTVGTATPSAAERHVLTAAEPVGYGVAEAAGRTIGAVRGVVVGEALHVARLAVHPEHRRQGTAGALMAAVGAWGAAHGANRCVLQVAIGNAAALALYRALGFTEHHRYRYWVPASGDASSCKDRRL